MNSEINVTSSVENKNILFFNKCRLCLENEGYAELSDVKELSNNIYTYMGIKVQESDELPNKICRSCSKTIVDFVDLTSRATKNEVYLRTLLSGSTIKEDIVDSTNNVENTDDLISLHTLHNSNMPFLAVRKDLYESPSTSTSVKEENQSEQFESRTDIKCELKCNICFKTFKTRKQHMLHQRSHNKSFSCPIHICGKRFATKGDLEKHIRSHTGERPFQCDKCQKSFTQRVTLKTHKINIHNMET